jgi:hypothetical protein
MNENLKSLLQPLLDALEKAAKERPDCNLQKEGISFEVNLPTNCKICGTPVILNHPDRPGGITYYCGRCDEHVRIWMGLVPIRLKHCQCGAWARFDGEWRCTACGHTWEAQRVTVQ